MRAFGKRWSGMQKAGALVAVLVLAYATTAYARTHIIRDDAVVQGALTVDGTSSLTGGVTFGGVITLDNAETIDNTTDDMIEMQGAGGTDNTDLRFDLDGTHPVLSSPTDTRIEFAEDVTCGGDLTISGDDIFMLTNTTGFLLVADGTSFNPVATSGDVLIVSSGATTIQANAVALATDTTGNYCATVADAGNSTVSVAGSGAENAAITLDVIDLNCIDCIGANEIADVYLLNSGDTSTGTLSLADGVTDSPRLDFIAQTGTVWQFLATDADDDFEIQANSAGAELLQFNNLAAGTVNVELDGDL